MSDFIVKLDGIKLTKEQEASINREIQGAVLRELAKVDTNAEFSARIPKKEWLGIWIRNKAFDVGNVKFKVDEF